VTTHFNPAFNIIGEEVRGIGETRDAVDHNDVLLGFTAQNLIG
jgi:hypothetical protein